MIVRAAREAMRCRFELVLDGDDARFLRAAADAALDEVCLWEARLSRFRRDSLLAHLERHGARGPVRVEPEVLDLFETAESVRAASGGAFDPAFRTGGQVLVDRDAGTLALSRPGVRLDLGAIGKGFAIDRAIALLRELGVERALLHGGSSTVFALGAPPDLDGWRVAFAGLGAVEAVALRDHACSVSAQHGRALEDGTGHVRDPRGRSAGAEDPSADPAPAAAELRPVAVVAPTATLADAWSTALLVDPGRAREAEAAGVTRLDTDGARDTTARRGSG